MSKASASNLASMFFLMFSVFENLLLRGSFHLRNNKFSWVKVNEAGL